MQRDSDSLSQVRYHNSGLKDITLVTGKDDFKLGKFCASSKYYFEPFYGVHNNGDVMDPENIDSLEEFIMKGTKGMGVDLMMADGGFSVEGNENIQVRFFFYKIHLHCIIRVPKQIFQITSRCKVFAQIDDQRC